ncbi:N-acetylgalactosamine-6-sulfatase [Nymphon striatum]|nr:N-acetylgalactosamine-6-sulfatase [Nymphon striatum]
MTGRIPVRSGTTRIPQAGQQSGLVTWERTIAEVLKDQGYRTGHFGKWHLGDTPERHPNARGFDEWWGLLETHDSSLWSAGSGYDPSVVPREQLWEGSPSVAVSDYGVDERRFFDSEVFARTEDFVRRSAATDEPFFAYMPIAFPHFPALPHPDFVGVTGNGDFADAFVELDTRVGQLADLLDELDIADNTVLIITSDNGAEDVLPWRGWSGPWGGSYFTAMEGSASGAVHHSLARSDRASCQQRHLPCRRPVHDHGFDRITYGDSLRIHWHNGTTYWIRTRAEAPMDKPNEFIDGFEYQFRAFLGRTTREVMRFEIRAERLAALFVPKPINSNAHVSAVATADATIKRLLADFSPTDTKQRIKTDAVIRNLDQALSLDRSGNAPEIESQSTRLQDDLAYVEFAARTSEGSYRSSDAVKNVRESIRTDDQIGDFAGVAGTFRFVRPKDLGRVGVFGDGRLRLWKSLEEQDVWHIIRELVAHEQAGGCPRLERTRFAPTTSGGPATDQVA